MSHTIYTVHYTTTHYHGTYNTHYTHYTPSYIYYIYFRQQRHRRLREQADSLVELGEKRASQSRANMATASEMRRAAEEEREYNKVRC